MGQLSGPTANALGSHSGSCSALVQRLAILLVCSSGHVPKVELRERTECLGHQRHAAPDSTQEVATLLHSACCGHEQLQSFPPARSRQAVGS